MNGLEELALFKGARDKQLGLHDAACIEISGAHIATSTDFIGPTSRDPADYGYIAVAHSLSDLFAVGVQPTAALVLAAWPREADARTQLPAALEGMHAALRDANVTAIGGHTAYSAQPLLGVTSFGSLGAKVIAAEVSDGDLVCLTKPLGSGIVIGALREGDCPADLETTSLASMRILNRAGLSLSRHARVKLVSDVTGFGVFGQLIRLSDASATTIIVEGAAIPAFPGVRELIARGTGTMAAERNWNLLSARVAGGDRISRVLASDPQTNGPLLVVGAFTTRDLIELNLTRIGAVAPRQQSSLVVM
jgi:selenide,water dikinase